MVFAIELGVAIILSIPITYIIIHLHKEKDRKLIFGDKLEDNQDDNPLLLTVKAMESELAELHENNTHMKRIAQLEKDIEEANKHAEALSNLSEDYGNTMEEVGESIAGGISGRSAVHTVKPNSKKLVEETTRQNTIIFRTYTSPTGWSTYYDVKTK